MKFEHTKYFDFDMLEKHAGEFYAQICDTFLLAFILIVVYYAYKLFEKYDR